MGTSRSDPPAEAAPSVHDDLALVIAAIAAATHAEPVRPRTSPAEPVSAWTAAARREALRG